MDRGVVVQNLKDGPRALKPEELGSKNVKKRTYISKTFELQMDLSVKQKNREAFMQDSSDSSELTGLTSI
jgi:hypothetical protein